MSTVNLLRESVRTLRLKSHFIIGMRARKGTPEPESFLSRSSKPPKTTMSLLRALTVEVNSRELISGGPFSVIRSPVKLDCMTLISIVISP